MKLKKTERLESTSLGCNMLNLKTLADEKKRLRNFIDNRLQSHFDMQEVNFSKRIRLESDLEKWKTDIIETHNQASGKSARWYSIYFDNEFICSFNMDNNPGQIELLFLNNFYKMYETEQIFLDKNEYIIREELRKKKERDAKEAIDKVVNSAPSEIKEIIKEIDAPAK